MTLVGQDPRAVVHDLVAGAVPLDEHEVRDRAITLRWVRSAHGAVPRQALGPPGYHGVGGLAGHQRTVLAHHGRWPVVAAPSTGSPVLVRTAA